MEPRKLTDAEVKAIRSMDKIMKIHLGGVCKDYIENYGIPPLEVIKAMLTILGNIAQQYFGTRGANRILQAAADVYLKRIKKRMN